MRRDGFFIEIDGESVWICFGSDLFLNSPGRNRVPVAVKENRKIGMDREGAGVTTVGQRMNEGVERFGFEALAGPLSGGGMQTYIGDGISPLKGLAVHVVEIHEVFEGPEVVPNVVDGAFFNFSLLVGPTDVTGVRRDFKGAQEREKGLIIADDGALALGDGGGHVVEDKLFGCSAEENKGIEEASVKGLLALRVGKLEVEQPAVTFDDGKAIELSAPAPIRKRAEVAPIYLALLSGRRFETDARGGVSLAQGADEIFDDGVASMEPQREEALKDDLGTGVRSLAEKGPDFIFEGIEPAGAWGCRSGRVRGEEVFGDGLSIESEDGGDPACGKAFMMEPVNFKDGSLIDHGLPPRMPARICPSPAASPLEVKGASSFLSGCSGREST